MNFHQKPNKFVSRVHLKVQHLERSLAFYQEVIGFKVLNRTAKAADLTADGRTVLLTVEQPDNVIPKQGRTTGLYHFALLLPSRQDLAGIVRHFAALNQRFGSSDHLVSEALYLSDPDGNGIEVYADRDDADWSWNGGQVEMAVDPLDFENSLQMEDRRNGRAFLRAQLWAIFIFMCPICVRQSNFIRKVWDLRLSAATGHKRCSFRQAGTIIILA